MPWAMTRPGELKAPGIGYVTWPLGWTGRIVRAATEGIEVGFVGEGFDGEGEANEMGASGRKVKFSGPGERTSVLALGDLARRRVI